jgi:molybdate transport system ATP-binding protein
MDIHGTTVRIRGTDQADGSTGLAADVTADAVADLAPGRSVFFAVKAEEVELHAALAQRS